MADQPETPDPELAGKQPAPVVAAGSARKAPARRAGTAKAAAAKAPAVKKAAAKKTVAKKAAAKKAAAKKAPAEKTAAKKRTAAVKKAVAKKEPAGKKAPAKRATAAKKAPAAKRAEAAKPATTAPARTAPARTAPARTAPAKVAPPEAPAPAAEAPVVASITEQPEPVIPSVTAPPAATPGVEEPLRAADSGRRDRWALCASLTEDLLNDVVMLMVGDGVQLEPLETSVTLPALGEVDIQLGLSVNRAAFRLRADDGGRARIVISALGDVSTRSAAYDGATVEGAGLGAPMGVPTPPAPIPIRVEALVDPFVEVHADHTVSVGLDLDGAHLISLEADSDAPVPQGVDPTAWAGILQMFGMLFGMLGHSLFESLGGHVGTVGTELGAEVGMALVELGVDPGRADVHVSSGLLSFGLPATSAVRGRAQPVPIAGRRVGIGLADSVVEHLTQKLLERAAGDLPLPFEVELDLHEQSVGGRVRQSRLLPEPFPDLRSALRTEIRPRLVRGRLELSVQAAWVELPPVVPSLFNQISKRLGELVSLAPMRVQFPARLELPLVPDSPDLIPVEIDDLRVTENGLGIVVAMV